MTKHRILRTIGDSISGVSLIAMFVTLSIDLDQSKDNAWQIMLGVTGICILGTLLGQFLSNFSHFEGIIFGVLAVTFAWLYQTFKTKGPLMKSCYNMKKKIGSYKGTFTKCRELYQIYIDSELDDKEVSHE